MRYGVIGTGWIAKSFIDGARILCNADFFAVYSRTKDSGSKFASENSIPTVFTDINEFANGDFDAVYIASPNKLHYEQSKLMLQNGKHVICEKPITVEPEELEELQTLAKKNGLIYIEAIMYMFNPAKDLLKDALKKIGRITSVHFDFSQLSSKYPAYLAGSLPNIFNPALATGCLMDLGVYCVYPALDLFGLPEKITACAHFMESGADGSGNAAFLYSDKLVNLTYSKLGQDRLGSQIFGDEGTIVIESISKLTNMKLIDNKGNVTEIIGDVEKERIMGYEAQAFEGFINNPDNPYYFTACERALQTSKAMKEIRNLSKIRFTL
ncbi:MAG: Gfo/Idh/MocA family oxidoreductase [Clostridia bacterium]|nr:Gfo/Idh/MocA family oxidoreductase [Clostridia bacterium]